LISAQQALQERVPFFARHPGSRTARTLSALLGRLLREDSINDCGAVVRPKHARHRGVSDHGS